MLYKVSNKKTTSPLRGTPPQEENLARDKNDYISRNLSPADFHSCYFLALLNTFVIASKRSDAWQSSLFYVARSAQNFYRGGAPAETDEL